MLIKAVTAGIMEANSYIVRDDFTKEAFVIDPGGDYKKIKKFIDESKLKVKAVINTHGHGDHIAANADFGVPIWIHRLDAEFLHDPSKNLSNSFGFLLNAGTASRLLEEGDILTIGANKLEVMHTPGHTPGSICLKGDGVVFTGDTLFCSGIGRTDFLYGSEEDITRSIKNKLLTLDDDYIIYPGHGSSSTIGEEKKNNAFIT